MSDDQRPYKFLRLCVRPWGLITAAGAIACVGTFFSFLGRWSWFLDIFSHFRIQYLAGLTVIALLLLIPRHRKTALIFAAFALINLVTLLPFLIPSPTTPPQEADSTVRIILANVNSRTGKPELVAKMIHDYDPDILILEEITPTWINNLQSALSIYPYTKVRARDDNFGIGMFSKIQLANDDIIFWGSAGVPSIVGDISTEQGIITIVATHPLPPGGADYSRYRNEQLRKIGEYIITKNTPVLLMGDLNATPWNYHFQLLLKQTHLQDSSQSHGIDATWPTSNPLLRIPLDHCLHSPEIIITDKQIGPHIGSDHFPIIVDFCLPDANLQ